MKRRSLDFIADRLRESALARRLAERARTAASVATHLVSDLAARRRGVPHGERPFGASPHEDGQSVVAAAPAAAPVSSDGVLADHLGAVVEKRLEKLSECRRWRSAEDPVEAVHDLRVASRRLRAFVDVFQPLIDDEVYERTERPLRKVTRAARAVRDLDVHVTLLIDRLDRATSDAERAALEYLLEDLERGRRKTEARAEKKLGRIDFDELRLSVSTALGETVARLPHDRAATAVLAHELIGPLVQKACRDRPADDGIERPDEMHRLRIDLKKVRYGLELFEPTLGERYESLRGRAEKLQELLGAHHDVVVLGEMVDERRKRLERKDRHTLLVGLESLDERLLAERRQLLARFRSEGFDPEWWEREVRSAFTG